MSYTDPFGGSTVQPAQVAYRAVALAANTTLEWSWIAIDDNYVARVMDVTASAPGLALTLPSATNVGVGFDLLFTNPGANSYEVKRADGTTLLTVAPGVAQYAYITDNSTVAGTWRTLQFASLSSAVVAAALIGPGIAASGSALYNALVTTTVSASYAVLVGDRTKTFAWTGGIGTLTLPTAASVGNDFFIAVANQGTGVLTIARSSADTVDGATSIQLNLGESCILHSGGGTAWYSIGRGRSVQFNFTLLSKAVSTGTYTLTTAEAQNVVQKYTGVLVANVDIVLPSTVQVYYVSNQTTGAFNLRFKTAGVGTTVTVPTGQNAILFCDGLNVINTSTTVAGIAAFTMNAGTVASPSLNYTGDLTTGFYQPSAGTVGVSITGVERARFSATVPLALTTAASGTAQTWTDGAVNALIGFGGTNAGLGTSSAHALRFITNNTERGRFTSDGNLQLSAPATGTTLSTTVRTDTAVGALFTSANKGLRLNGASALQFAIEAVDNTGSASFQPLVVGGSTLTFQISNNNSLSIDANRAVSIAAPIAGNTLSITCLAGSAGVDIASAGLARQYIRGAVGFGASLSLAGNGTSVGTSSFDLQQDGSSNADVVQRSNARMSLYTNNLERVRINAAGGAQVLTPASGTALVVNGISTGVSQEWTEGSSVVQLQQSPTFSSFGTSSAHQLNLLAGNTARLVISGTTGQVTIPNPSSGVALTVGGVANVASGAFSQGVSVGNVTNTSTTTLDWYEESGALTPTLLFGGANTGITYTTQDGRWQRVGNWVHFWLYIELNSKGSATGAVTVVHTIPYLPSTSRFQPAVVDGVYQGLTGAVLCRMSNTVEFTLGQWGATGFSSITDANMFAAVGRIAISGSYRCA